MIDEELFPVIGGSSLSVFWGGKSVFRGKGLEVVVRAVYDPRSMRRIWRRNTEALPSTRGRVGQGLGVWCGPDGRARCQ